MGFPLNEMNFEGCPPHRPGPQHPGRHWNDTECAVEISPWEECCGEGDNCLCLTTADISAWDDVVNTVATNSGSWGSAEPGPSPEISATLWNETFETVAANSASWSDTTVADNSAKWNEISASLTSAYTSGVILGNGTKDNPIHMNESTVKDWSEGTKLARFLTAELYEIDGETRKWVPIDGLNELTTKVENLTSAWERNETVDQQQWNAISRLGKGGSLYEFRYEKHMDPKNLSQYSEPNVIYYTDEW